MTEVGIADLFDQAKQSLASGNFAVAEGLCRDVLAVQPGEPNFLALLGSVLHAAGRSPEGIKFTEKALAIAPQRAETHVLKGLLLRSLNNNKEAAASFHDALRLEPSLARAHIQLGDLARTRFAYSEAADHFRCAAELEPNHFLAFMALGDTLLQLQRFDDAIEAYKTAIRLGPSDAMAETQRNLGVALRHTAQYEGALQCLAKAGDQEGSHAVILECLLALNRYDEFFSFLARNLEAHRKNLSIAAISAYASQQLGRNDPHPFCPSPLEHIQILPNLGLKDRRTALEMVTALINTYDDYEVFWEPVTNATVKGYSSVGNVFDGAKPVISELRQLLLAEAGRYRQSIKPDWIGMSRDWPLIPRLHGWYVRLSTGGYENPHIHPHGWLSGVLYLQLPKIANVDEGAIEFGLKSPRYPEVSGDLPRLVHRPVVGELILFPSTLHHRTIPFSGLGEERISLAFDLCP